MATPTLNIELLQYFSPIILFVLVFVLIYAMFQWAKILGQHKGLHAIMALCIALFIAVFSDGARAMVSFAIPWFTVLAIFITLAIMLYKIFGATDDQVRSVLAGRPDIQWTLFVIIIIIILGAFANAYGQSQLKIKGAAGNETTIAQGDNLGSPGTKDTASGDFNQNLGATFYHPRVLGMLLILIIAALAIGMLTGPVVKR